MHFEELLEIINSKEKFVVTTHLNPDADAIGSQMALYFLLKAYGKEVRLINHSPTPDSLEFMDKKGAIEVYSADEHDAVILSAEALFFLDLNASNRVGNMEKVCLKSTAVKIIVDHHTNPEDFVDFLFADVNASSTGELIYRLIKQSGKLSVNREVAEVIYAAIVADTGSFHYDRTTPEIHEIAAELLKIGVEPDKVYEELYEKGTIGRLRLLGSALSSLKQNDTKEVTYMVITKSDLEENGATEADIEGFVGYTLAVEGTKIGLLFYDLEKGFKISFRSKGKIPVNKFAEEFGGGGHLNAAGARLYNSSLIETLPKVIEASLKYLKYY